MELHLHNESSYIFQIQLQHSLYSPERKNILLNSRTYQYLRIRMTIVILQLESGRHDNCKCESVSWVYF